MRDGSIYGAVCIYRRRGVFSVSLGRDTISLFPFRRVNIFMSIYAVSRIYVGPRLPLT